MRLISECIQVLPLIITLFGTYVRSDESCDSIKVDAITALYNGTVAIFQKSHVWLWNKEARNLMGPCPDKAVFETKKFKGPVDAAVTINDHPSIVEFIGSTLLFVKKSFFTFKNVKPYVVEWGSLEYIPVTGGLKMMASSSESAQKIIDKSLLSAAYYDPIDSTTKFVFTDQSVMAFTFAYGIEFESPVITTLSKELNSFGVDMPSNPVTALLTLNTNNGYQMYVFSKDKYCSFEMKKGSAKQKCDFKPVKELFECKDIETTSCAPGAQKRIDSDQPIAVAVNTQNPLSNPSRGTVGRTIKIQNRKIAISSRSGLVDSPKANETDGLKDTQKSAKHNGSDQRDPVMFVHLFLLLISLLSVIH